MEQPHEEKKTTYWPLFVLLIVSILMGFALGKDTGWKEIMRFFMGSFLCLFSLVKLFDIKGFASTFSMYDLLAMRYSAYGFAYPFIELILGLGFLTGHVVSLFALLTAVLMIFGSLGVFKAMIDKKDLHCACMGSLLNVPLSFVSLTEDLLMAIMSIIVFIDKI